VRESQKAGAGQLGISFFLYSIFHAVRGRSLAVLENNDWFVILFLSIPIIGLWGYAFWRGISLYVASLPDEVIYLLLLLIGLLFMALVSPLFFY